MTKPTFEDTMDELREEATAAFDDVEAERLRRKQRLSAISGSEDTNGDQFHCTGNAKADSGKKVVGSRA